MLKYLIFASLFFGLSVEGYYCTKWVEQRSVSCQFAGENAEQWKRQCERPCGYQNNYDCDLEKICLLEDPNKVETDCTRWFKKSGVICADESGRWVQQWVRACTRGGHRLRWCSRRDPNNRD
jgi:hypothetical protein